jgi:hypothetical protein
MSGKVWGFVAGVAVVVVGFWVVTSGYIPNPIAKKSS